MGLTTVGVDNRSPTLTRRKKKGIEYNKKRSQAGKAAAIYKPRPEARPSNGCFSVLAARAAADPSSPVADTSSNESSRFNSVATVLAVSAAPSDDDVAAAVAATASA